MDETRQERKKRLVMGISGASGMTYAMRFLQSVNQWDPVEIHLVITANAQAIIAHELGPQTDLSRFAFQTYRPDDLMAPICSGSFPTDGMIIIPCSMKTVAGLACGYADNLLLRAADVTLKEKRPLLIVPREAPFGVIHLENLYKLAQWGVQVMPACPSFYHLPRTLDEVVDQFVFRVMDRFGLKSPIRRWGDRPSE